MTFIASVVAQNGVAIIADSLVTNSGYVLGYHDFKKYVNGIDSGKNLVDFIKELDEKFEKQPLYTKNYVEKLFRYDKYTAITIAGSAALNDKSFDQIIADAIKEKKPDRKSAKKKSEDLADILNVNLKEHLNKHRYFSGATLILTHFNKSESISEIYKINIHDCVMSDVDTPMLVSVDPQNKEIKVVFDGQNRSSIKLLFGGAGIILNLLPKIVDKIASDHSITLSKEYRDSVLYDDRVVKYFREETKISQKLTQLSIQQAIDLACLLMKIEIDIQNYTENLPTVGGVIKVAVIDKEGFRFLNNALTVSETFIKHV